MAVKSRERRRDRESRRRAQGRGFAEEQDRLAAPGTASDYIVDFTELAKAKPGIRSLLYCRDSERNQDHNGNLDGQESVCAWIIRDLGASLVDEPFKRVESGFRFDYEGRAEFIAAITRAKEIGDDVIVVAESTSRLIRAADYTSENWTAWPTIAEFEELRRLADGVMLATILRPDAAPQEERAFQSKRGQKARGDKKVGRPKKIPKGKLLADAMRLHHEGKSYRAIAKLIGVPKSTVKDWRDRDFCVSGLSAHVDPAASDFT